MATNSQDAFGEIRHNPSRGRYREYKYVVFYARAGETAAAH